MKQYTTSQALTAIREILYHPVKTDEELVKEIQGVIELTEGIKEKYIICENCGFEGNLKGSTYCSHCQASL